MAALRKRFLKKNWSDTIQSKLLRSSQGEDDSFDVWVEALEATNALLHGTTAVFSEKRLREHIESHACEELRSLAETTEVQAVMDFQDFKESLSEADVKRRIDRNRRKREIEAIIASRTRVSVPTSRVTTTTLSRPLAGGSSAGATANTRTAPLPKLTEDERKLLGNSGECLKCRKVNAGHFAKSCPNSFPDPASYRNLVTGKLAVAMIAEITPIEEDVFEIPHVAVVKRTPSLQSSVLTSDDDDWDSDKQKRLDNRRAKREEVLMEQERLTLEAMWQETQRKDVIRELNLRFGLSRDSPPLNEPPLEDDIVASIQQRIDQLALTDVLARENQQMRTTFADCFPDDIPHLNELPTDVYHHFRLKDPNAVIARRQYECPKKYREAWKTLLQQHLDAGRIRPSSSPYASPAFLIPKKDSVVLPRWVNDYRKLNANTIPDAHPLPSIAEILSDCGKGKFFAKIDMTNSFFQTRVHPDDIPLTAVTTPFGLYEWTVMPQGCRNAPATHQRRMFNALRDHIGSICHVYLDDIVIWSETLDEHRRNVATVLECLRRHKLYCSPKKTDLFCISINFLGHYISANGIEADNKKVEKILDWPVPRLASDVRSFLGLVRYISNFLPSLAQHTLILNTLTTKEAEKDFRWTPAHFQAFESVKLLVTSRECLTVIDHNNLGNNKIFVSCDASDFCTGAVLTYGPTPETARPVAFESQQLSGAELNYPVHEKELLAIVRAMQKWRVDLLGVPFVVFSDHRTLENFTEQKHLSRRQARWQEFMSQYDYTITYIAGIDNALADAMSRKPTVSAVPPIGVVSAIEIRCDLDWVSAVKSGYLVDPWCLRLLESLWDSVAQKAVGVETVGVSAVEALSRGWLDTRVRNGIGVRLGLLYVGERLVVPRTGTLREDVFNLAHDTLGHWGSEKSYAAIRASYYWPHMRKELESIYVPACESCQRNKSGTKRPTGPLHPLPVPDGRCDSVAMDFVGPLPEDDSHNCILTITDRLGSDLRIIPCHIDISAKELATIFFREWYCENGLPLEIVSDRDKLFVSQFWKYLHRLTGVKLKMSTAFHPQTDGSSERSNRTIIQALRFHVERNQKGWARALPLVRFNHMNTVNASTGFTPFQLHCGRQPRIIPPLQKPEVHDTDSIDAAKVIAQLETDVMEAQDNLLLAKSNQAFHADKTRGPESVYSVGDKVMLSTFHRRRDFMQRGDHRVAKFMVRWDGPYLIHCAWPESSLYELELPGHTNIFPKFHASLLKRHIANDDTRYPSRAHEEPAPTFDPETREDHHFVERILDRRRRGRGWQYLVHWKGFGPEHDEWLPGSRVDKLEALDTFLRENALPLDG
ncbi:hypothetical protein PHLCEN_2v11626 [Hermanssonia centrifuga]|uniref:Reverse transcriptase n=1 Tax=Hermanssonia centrifuga TaxID=98765 RepID=A0A2R6NJH7_9APHY|nr:hypothetical protein PHLCEN_2v11626 [Hermanssonia centrifuga]